MTSIAYRDGVLASDTLFTAGNLKVPGRATKLFRVESGQYAGQLFAFCGTVCHGMAVLAALQADDDPPHIKNTTCILIDKRGWPWEYEGAGVWLKNSVKWGAWGSGRDFAYGALHMGATAVEAVKAAITYDTNCRGPVKVLKVEQ